MTASDAFHTIKSSSEIEIKIKGSKFIGQAVPCSDENDAERILADIRKKYYDATHHCFGYRVGLGTEQKFRYSDAGEPSGTAGKPIYDRIEGKELTNLIVVVTRYFGGTKLGTGGLTHAYSDAAGEVIDKAGVITAYITERLSLTVPYSDYNNIERLIHKYDGIIIDRRHTSPIPSFVIEIRKSSIDEFRERAIDITSGRIKIEPGA
jgi:uncharacterized YigZ family protein